MTERIFRKIFVVLLFLILLVPWFVVKDFLFPFITGKAFAFRLLIEAMLPFYLYLFFFRPELRPSKKNWLNYFILLFLIVNLVSAFAGVNVSRSLWGNFERMGGVYYLTHLCLLYFYIQLLAKIQPTLFKLFLNFLVLNGVLLTLSGYLGKLFSSANTTSLTTWIIDYLKLNSWPIFFEKIADPSLPVRVSASFGNPIFFASFLIVPLFFSLYLLLQSENFVKKIYFICAFFIILSGIIQTGTRGAVVGLVLGFLFGGICYLFFSANKSIRFFGGIVLLVFCLSVAIGIKYKNLLPETSSLRRILQFKDTNSQSRLLQWKVALNGLKDRPILGTGTENYYVVANKYYKPEIYKYDGSWFDKPHNYWIEILITNGLLGFVVYFGIFVLCLYSIFFAYKKAKIVSLAEACVLCGGVVAYQVQNLFVFDTVSTSLVFFISLAFCAFLWEESLSLEFLKNKSKDFFYFNKNFVYSVFVLGLFVFGYCAYFTNILPAKASKNINYAYAYISVDPKLSKDYFNEAFNSRFNFDQPEVVLRYNEFVQKQILEAGGLVVDEKKELLKNAIEITNHLAKTIKNNPVLWQQLGSLYLSKAFLYNQPLEPETIMSINMSQSLAPKRVESLALLAQTYLFKGEKEEAIKQMEFIVSVNPNPQNTFQLLNFYKITGEFTKALKIVYELKNKGHVFSSLDQLLWVIDYYEQKKDYNSAILWYEEALKLNPQDISFYVRMAKNFWLAEQKNKAKDLANRIFQVDPKQVENLNEILKFK